MAMMDPRLIERLEAAGLPTDLEGMLDAAVPIAGQRGWGGIAVAFDDTPTPDSRWQVLLCGFGGEWCVDGFGMSSVDALGHWLLAAKEAHHA